MLPRDPECLKAVVMGIRSSSVGLLGYSFVHWGFSGLFASQLVTWLDWFSSVGQLFS